jgi:hypothetical protein
VSGERERERIARKKERKKERELVESGVSYVDVEEKGS